MAAKSSQYRVVVKPVLERAEAISAALLNPDYHNKFFHFKASEQSLPVVTLPIDILLYRVANARTKDDQLSLIAKQRFKEDFFDTSRQEDVDVQQAQHDILFGFAQQGQGESVVPIYGELEKKKKQTEPILITDHGLIVNGNRRMAAMRELLSQPGTGGFNHVACMVLPANATEADLIEIEFKLQMAPETRLPYTWTNEARICKQLRDAGRSIERIAEIKDDDPKRVTTLILMYENAERYLNEWVATPGAFDKLDGTRQAFHQMAVRRQKNRSQPEKEIAQAFDFFVVENRDSLEERAYDFINAIEGDPARFAESYAESVGIKLAVDNSASNEPATQELFIDLAEETQKQQMDLMPLVGHLKVIRKDKDKSESALQTVEAVCELLNAQKKNAGDVALNFARQALKKLTNVDPSTAHKKTIPELLATLQKIEEKAQALLVQAQSK